MSSTCLSNDTVLAFVLGDLPAEAITRVEAHLAGCASCRIVVATAARFLDRDSAPDASIADGGAAAAAELLAPGASVGRYVIAEPRGAGAAGVVYAADDPQLARRVALKILPASDETTRARWLREAQAMARLSHPNVVNVHDAFEIERGRIVIVMELVSGLTLAAWLAERPRPWREILGAFRDAGRGLAAAHAAGLVHRDFKPDNVLVGDDGRVRLADFGLARSPATAGPAETAGLAGTPAYMAPEQFLGRGGDARSDQFSFCVALYTGLYGRRPFAAAEGASVAALARAVGSGQPQPPPQGSRVPPRLFAVLRRGLSATPEDRYPSLDRLLDALSSAGAGRGPARWIAVGAVALAASGLALAALRGPRCGNGLVEGDEQCDDGNASETDGCLSGCRLARCGDGQLRRGVEECDDGNTADGDGCSGHCLACRTRPGELLWPANDHCYTSSDELRSWSDARAACEKQGGATLVTFASIHEANAVSAAFLERDARPSWIGMRDGPGARPFRWVTGEPIAVMLWPDGPVSDGHGCVLQDPARVAKATPESRYRASWQPVDCSRPAGSLCERAPALLRPRDRRAYRPFFFEQSWPEARTACAALGGHLATITDADEQAFLAASVGREFWIGATDQARDGHFTWITGEPLAFRAFAPREPDNESGHSYCVWVGTDRVWHDRPCAQKAPYVCEFE
jgi:cysteine-rich repeat protein